MPAPAWLLLAQASRKPMPLDFLKDQIISESA
jgi:hypothetical protein